MSELSLLFASCLFVALLPGPSAAEEAVWQPVACPAADRAPRDRFETVELVDTFEEGLGQWAAHLGGQQAKSSLTVSTTVKHSGAAALRVDFDFVGKEDFEYVDFGRPMEVAERGLGLGFWVKTESEPLRLRVRIYDKTGECHQLDLGAPSSGDWEYVACAFDAPGGWWGGDGNKRLDYPCTVRSILSDRPRRGYVASGCFWIDEVALVRPRKFDAKLKVETADKRLGNVYEPGDTVRLRLSGPGDQIRWQATDYWGAEVASGAGEPTRTEAAVTLDKAGHYVVALERLEGGQVVERRLFRCAALPLAHPKQRNDFVGVGCHFRGLAYPLESMDLLVRYGFRHFRDEVSWSSVEQEKGKLTFVDYGRQFTDRAQELGLEPLLIFDYANRHYDGGGFPDSPEAIAAYARYAAQLATWVKGKVNAFEVWNEYSIGCGMGGKQGQTPEQYARMIAAAYKAVKQARPDCTLVGLGGEHSAHHVDFIEGMLKSGAAGNMDAFSVHSYRYPTSPEASKLWEEIRNVSDLVQRNNGPGARCWVTEIGWPTQLDSRGVDERTQARYVVRTYALLQAAGCERVYWYDFKNDGLQREYNESNFGVVWHQQFNYQPKPAAVALSVFTRLTAGAEVVRLWNEGDAFAVFYREADGSDLVVAWSAQGVSRVQVDRTRLTVLDAMGNELTGSRNFDLTEDPVYFIGQGVQLTSLP